MRSLPFLNNFGFTIFLVMSFSASPTYLYKFPRNLYFHLDLDLLLEDLFLFLFWEHPLIDMEHFL